MDKRVEVNDAYENIITAYHRAIYAGNEDIYTKLQSASVEVDDVVNGKNEMPLHVASKCGYSNVVKLLLSRGASVNEVNCDNNTPPAPSCSFYV